MAELLSIASRVEAAVQAYLSVQNLLEDEREWRGSFEREFDKANEVFRCMRKENGSYPPAHPTLMALSIVLSKKEDLSRITRSHPDIGAHRYYNQKATFPSDISDMLPSSGADRWWDSLAETARSQHAARSPLPPNSPPVQRMVALRFTEPTANPEDKAGEDSPMAVDEDKDEGRGRPGAPKEPTSTRKRKGSTAATPGTAKRRAKPTKEGPPEAGSESKPKCEKCERANKKCETPNGKPPCARCKEMKLGCSLMPVNPVTGKSDRRMLPAANLLDEDGQVTQGINTRSKSNKEKGKGKGKRKQHSEDSPDSGRPEGSSQAHSPEEPLAGLRNLTLDSGGSSSNNSPPMIPNPALLAPSPPAPLPSGPKNCNDAKASDKVPSAPHLLGPARPSRSHSDASPVSDDRSVVARVSAVEKTISEQDKEMSKVKNRLRQIESLLGSVNGRVKFLET